jgi:beta-ureidopropionase / N-carbamoyl-L-amino-acid hydrolase
MPYNPERLQADFERFAAIGGGAGGSVTRLALTPADREARLLFVQLLQEAGLAVRIDRFGNIWGRTGGRWAEPAVLSGSHLDSVPNGGRYDGTAGVVAALEAVRSLVEDGVALPAPLEVVAFTAEESARYGVATIGSKGVSGVLTAEAIYALKDRQGIPFADAVAENAGWELVGGPQEPGSIGCFLEMHVEQGKELELAGMELGVVRAIAAPTRFKVTLHGQAAHSGATLMTWRKDGLVAASELVLALERIAEIEEEFGTVATATIFALHPVSINVVPGKVEMGVDIRGIDSVAKRRAVQRFRQTVGRVSAMRGIPIDLELLSDEEPVQLDPGAVEQIRLGCEQTGRPSMLMHSRAGHDAMNMAKRWPSAMLFVPSRDGVSHHPDEYTAPEQIDLGARALRAAMLSVATNLWGRG